MRTIGQMLKERRLSKKYSFEDLESQTKIKKSFLEAIEKEDWKKLPEYPVVIGFVRNIAGILDANKDHMVAILRRDYPVNKLPQTPKPDIASRFSWNPKLTSITASVVVIILVLLYLVSQYLKFSKNPTLSVDMPSENQILSTNTLSVRGKISSDASVFVNNQPALVDDEGNYIAEIEISPQTQEVVVKAVSRSGKETVVSRRIKVELGEE